MKINIQWSYGCLQKGLFKHLSSVLFIGLGFIFITGQATATMTLPMTLQEIVDKSGQAFVGRLTDLDYGFDLKGRPATYARFEVIHPIKGIEDDSVLVKQFGFPEQATTDAFLHDLGFDQSIIVQPKSFGGGLISYRLNEEVVLFLYPPSPLGFTSPVGFGQGLFRIHDEPHGEKTVMNGFQNLFLEIPKSKQGPMSSLSMDPAARKIELNSFLRLVSDIVSK